MPRGKRGDGGEAVRREVARIVSGRHRESAEGTLGCAELVLFLPIFNMLQDASTALWSHLPSPLEVRVLVVAALWVAALTILGVAVDWLEKHPTRVWAGLLTVAGVMAATAVGSVAMGNLHIGTAAAVAAACVAAFALRPLAVRAWERLVSRPTTWSP